MFPACCTCISQRSLVARLVYNRFIGLHILYARSCLSFIACKRMNVSSFSFIFTSLSSGFPFLSHFFWVLYFGVGGEGLSISNVCWSFKVYIISIFKVIVCILYCQGVHKISQRLHMINLHYWCSHFLLCSKAISASPKNILWNMLGLHLCILYPRIWKRGITLLMNERPYMKLQNCGWMHLMVGNFLVCFLHLVTWIIMWHSCNVEMHVEHASTCTAMETNA